MARSLSIIGFLALAIGLLWIGQGTGAIAWPRSSFMINQLQWAGYGAVLNAIADAIGVDAFRRAPVTADIVLMSLEHGRRMHEPLRTHL